MLDNSSSVDLVVSGPRSLSGHRLAGDNLVRMIFFDTAGLSNTKHEPYIVVAGVAIHPDSQWKAIGQYLADMADTYVPPEHRVGFAFHATELFSGGKIFTREWFLQPHRWQILDDLLAIPKKFDLPVIWGMIPRARAEHLMKTSNAPFPAVIVGQMNAFLLAAAMAEHWMNEAAAEGELAQIIMENDHQSRRVYKAVQRYLSDPQKNTKVVENYPAFALTRIIFPMQFEEKTDSSMLQIADACAFAIKRWCQDAPDASRFYGAISQNLVGNLKS